jgi:hypothetical protein
MYGYGCASIWEEPAASTFFVDIEDSDSTVLQLFMPIYQIVRLNVPQNCNLHTCFALCTFCRCVSFVWDAVIIIVTVCRGQEYLGTFTVRYKICSSESMTCYK